MQYVLGNGRVLSGLVRRENAEAITLVTNLAAPDQTTTILRADIEEAVPGKVSAMPGGLLNVLTRDEVLALVSFVAAGDSLPPALRHAVPHAAPARD